MNEHVIDSKGGILNAQCANPDCRVHFGIKIDGGPVRCPICQTEQEPPLVRLEDTPAYYCQKDRVSFSVPRGQDPRCHICGATLVTTSPRQKGDPP